MLNHNDSYNTNSKLIIDNFEIKSANLSNRIKLEIYLDNIGDNNESVFFYKNNNSFIEIKCYQYPKIFKILDENISNNSKEISILKSNKLYLKNVYNILFYDEKKQIDFNNTFYEKVFEDDYNINDFIEINFRISLESDSISLINHIKSIYEILDENGNSLYIKSINLNEYKYFSKYIFIDENIFYNFTRDVKK